ncbi:MAG: DUF3187 family protein [Nitrospirae bacterium]|nr:DUF3187 family protein [Nitrospirota bacterium]
MSVSAFDSPLQVKNQFPLTLNILSPRFESPQVQDCMTVNLAYSSIHMVRQSRDYSVGLDLESTELRLGLRRIIYDTIEITAELPIVGFNAGFMDGFINKYHDTFGFDDYGRRNRPVNSFLFNLKENGKVLIEGKDGRFGLGDIRLGIKKALLTSDPLISIVFEVELPTGSSPKTGIGNGSLDAGGGLMISKSLSNSLQTYAIAGVVFPGNYRGYETIKLRNYLYAGAALEYEISKQISLIGQLTAQGSAYPKTHIQQIDRPAVVLAIGARYRLNKDYAELSFVEDPSTSGASDFFFNLSYKKAMPSAPTQVNAVD